MTSGDLIIVCIGIGLLACLWLAMQTVEDLDARVERGYREEDRT